MAELRKRGDDEEPKSTRYESDKYGAYNVDDIPDEMQVAAKEITAAFMTLVDYYLAVVADPSDSVAAERYGDALKMLIYDNPGVAFTMLGIGVGAGAILKQNGIDFLNPNS